MLFDHPDIGDVQKYVYLEGVILEVYLESPLLPPEKWDTADVKYEKEKVFKNAAIRYHCVPIGVNRDNGAIADGGRGFDKGDKVILMARIGTSPGLGEEYDKMYVIAHRDGICPCVYNYLFIRISPVSLIPHTPPYGIWRDGEYVASNPGSHADELCIVWDVAQNTPASIYNPITKQLYSFPVTVEEFKPMLDYFKFVDEELFTLTPQGDAQIQEAGFTPDWRSDIQGDKIRNGARSDHWWTSYDIYANPVLNLFSGFQMDIALDAEGVSTGAFTRLNKSLVAKQGKIEGWKSASPQAFNDDSRVFIVAGKGMNGENLSGKSYHLQTAFGEDEIWICAKNTYQGMIVSYCDAKWKFVRSLGVPPAVAIGNPHLDNMASGGSNIPGGGSISIGRLLEDVSYAMAASATQAGDGNMFSYGALKRINEGGLHRNSHPALRTTGIGSWLAKQKAIPLSPMEPVFQTAINTRVESVDVWYRYDNWMNSIQCSSATFGVDRTWWFASNAQQWRVKCCFIDTPIGSMWYSSPTWEVALWYMTGFNILFGGPTCRKDVPLNTHFIRQTKHSHRVISQIYITQRQGVTLWDDPARTFVRQELYKGVYDLFKTVPKPDVEAKIEHLTNLIHYYGLQINALDTTIIQQWEAASDTQRGNLLKWDGRKAEFNKYYEYLKGIDEAQKELAAIPDDDKPTDDIAFVEVPGTGWARYDTLTAAQKKEFITDRVYVRTKYEGEQNYVAPASLRNNRNEVEIMAACDTYSSLYERCGQMNPAKQTRNALLEAEIEKLITRYYEGRDAKDMSVFTLEMRIV